MRSTFPIGPHFTDSEERKLLARALRIARRAVLSSPAGRNHWSRGYHVRVIAAHDLQWSIIDGDESLARRLWACPMWRGNVVVGRGAAELATDGRLE
jgi:hypothetical protein